MQHNKIISHKKGHINSNEIIIKKGNKAITEVRELSETPNKHANIVENTSGKSRPMLLVIIIFLILTEE